MSNEPNNRCKDKILDKLGEKMDKYKEIYANIYKNILSLNNYTEVDNVEIDQDGYTNACLYINCRNYGNLINIIDEQDIKKIITLFYVQIYNLIKDNKNLKIAKFDDYNYYLISQK